MKIDYQKFMIATGTKQAFASLLINGKRNARPLVAKRIGQATKTPWEVWTELGSAAERIQALQQSPFFAD